MPAHDEIRDNLREFDKGDKLALTHPSLMRENRALSMSADGGRRNRSGCGHSLTITLLASRALLNFIDVDNRVVPSSKRKRHTANNQLQRVACVSRERDLITQGEPANRRPAVGPTPLPFTCTRTLPKSDTERRPQCLAHPVNTVGVNRECCVIGLADRCADDKRGLINRHRAANTNHNSAVVVIEQNRRRAARWNSGNKSLVVNCRITYPDRIGLCLCG